MSEKFPQSIDPEIIKESPEQDHKEYIPPVGPGSKSVPPSGDFRDLPPGLIPRQPKKK